MKAARKVQAAVHGKFLVATYRPNHGAGTGETAKDQHQALVVTADATSGVPCLIGADYGAKASDPRHGEIYLYGPRKDLVPTQ